MMSRFQLSNIVFLRLRLKIRDATASFQFELCLIFSFSLREAWLEGWNGDVKNYSILLLQMVEGKMEKEKRENFVVQVVHIYVVDFLFSLIFLLFQCTCRMRRNERIASNLNRFLFTAVSAWQVVVRAVTFSYHCCISRHMEKKLSIKDKRKSGT